MAANDWAQQLRENGHRVTASRLLVLDVITTKRHATPDQIVEEAQRRDESIDLSTVYRTLEMLDEAGFITHAHLGQGSPTYHAVDERPHVHLVCRGCGDVESIAADELSAVPITVRRARGFAVDISHLVLHGRCKDCTIEIEGD